MYVFGITGGVGAGKSTALKLLSDNFNAALLQADEIGREIMMPGHKCYNQIIEVFGDDILHNVDNEMLIDRSKLSELIFHNEHKRMVLNSIVHPLVKKEITERIGFLRCEEKYDFVFVEAALLIEDHYDIICDELWYIYADNEVRRRRLKESRGYSDEKIDSIFSSQLSDEVFRMHCRRIIDNSGDEAATLSQLKEIMAEYGKL